jgi:hypothetical protein
MQTDRPTVTVIPPSIRIANDRVELSVGHRIEKVVLIGAWFHCTSCSKFKPASDFGLRCVNGNQVRNQPQCKDCR